MVASPARRNSAVRTPKPEGATSGPILEAETVLAKLVAFYGIDPERILKLPLYLVEILMLKQGPLEAERLRNLVTASVAPHLEDGARKELMDGLEDMVEPLQPIRPAPLQPVVHDPEKAREWFAAMGIKVVSA